VAVSLHDFLAREIPPREMLLAPILPTQGLALLYSWRGVGKTHVALGIAYAVASGGSFLHWQASKPRRVLYVDGEMPGATMQERLAALALAQDKEPPADHFWIITPDLQPEFIPNLASADGQDAITEWLADGVDLVVIDNISTLCRTGGENESDAWEAVQGWLLTLRRRGISVLLVHHANKDGHQRGTSRREDILDTVISLRRPSDYQETECARFEVHYEKARGLLGTAVKPFEAALTVRDGAAVWTMRDIEDANLARVIAMLDDGLSVRDIAEELGISKSAAHRLKKKVDSTRETGSDDGR
jgi:putative DNA primase/helicase